MKKFALMAGTILAAVPAAASAQEVEEIIVTATKRSENLQKVPISVLAADGGQIAEQGITNVRELSNTMPAVKISLSPIGNFAVIRGIGTPGINQGTEQSVAIFHDGVYTGRSQLSRAPFLDVQRVEVLRGPQSILFGKNTIGGAIHVIDNKPSSDFEGQLTGSYGSFDEREFTGYINVPVSDAIRIRVAGRKYDMDGYMNNILTGKKSGSRDEWTLRGQVQFEPTETTSINLKWEHSQFDSGEQTTQLAIINPFNAQSAAFSGLNDALRAFTTGSTAPERVDRDRAVANDGGVVLGQVLPVFAGLPGFPDLPEFSKNRMDLGAITIEQEIGDATLTAVSGFAQYKYRDICDCDFAAIPLIQVDQRDKYKQYSQELRLASPKGVPVEYIVGGYYQHNTINFREADGFGTSLAYTLLGLPTPLLLPNLTRDYRFDQTQNLWSLFGQATWNVTDATRLTAGLRWFKDSKKARHRLDNYFTDGWDYSAIAAQPPGTIAFGNTPAEYDRFLASEFGATPLAPGVTVASLPELVYLGLLGTQEHDISRKRSESKVNWIVTAQHDFTPDIMGYATVSTGTKGGGFDARYLRDSVDEDNLFTYEEESATSYEIGLKSQLFNNSVRLNIAAFLIDVKDFQVSVFDGATAFLVDNAAKARSKGIEVELTWAPVEGLTINGAASIMDAKWVSYPGAPCWQSPASENRGNCVDRGTPGQFRDATGDPLPFAPDFSGNLNVAYERPVSGTLKVGGAVNVAYSSSFTNSGDGDPVYMLQKRNAKIDVRLAVGHVDGKWEIAFLGKNLTDQLTSFNSNNQPLVPGNGFIQTDRPRSFAVQAKLAF